MRSSNTYLIICVECGKKVVAKHPSLKRCPECRASVRKAQRVKASKAYQADKKRYNVYARNYVMRKALEHPDAYKAKNSKNAQTKKLQRQQDPEKAKAYKEYMAAYYQTHKEKLVANNKQWEKAHPEAVRRHRIHKNHVRRAKEAQAEGTWNYSEFEALCKACDYHCYYCQKQTDKLTAEHMMPISRGGTNWIENIVPVCGACNYSKKDKTLLEYFFPAIR